MSVPKILGYVIQDSDGFYLHTFGGYGKRLWVEDKARAYMVKSWHTANAAMRREGLDYTCRLVEVFSTVSKAR